MRLIDADKLFPDCMSTKGGVAISQSQIADAPTIEPQIKYIAGYECGYSEGIEYQKKQRPQGEWIDTGDMQEYWAEEYQCSICGAKDHWHNYCPNCGADMRDRNAT